MTSLPSRVLLAVLLSPLLPLTAQTSGAIGLFAGYYRPFGHFDPASIYSTALPTEPSDLRGPAWGGLGQLVIHRRFGLEAELAVARSVLPEVITPAGPRGPTNAEVDIAALEGQYDVSPKPERYRVWLGAGPAMIRHGGDAYAPYGSPVSVGGAASAAVVVPLRSELQLAFDLTTLWYVFDLAMPSQFQSNPGSLEHGAQRDALLRVGVRWGRL
jgi:hypothetical protein